MMRIKDGITFGEFNSMNEGLLLTHREDTPPEEKVIKESLPFVQGDYDFSRILGEAIRENRLVRYEFFIKEYNHDKRKMLEIKYENMLLNQGMGRIYDTANLGYYFYGKCIEADVSIDSGWQQLKLTLIFDCYPYMISDLQEGHDIWDEFNFELDVAQPVSYKMDGEYTFKELPIGSTATIGAWATTYASGGGKIPMGNIGVSGTITGMEYVTSSRSKRAYNVTGIDGLVVEQDIIQAHINPLKVTLINAGTASVTPKLDLTAKATIVKGNRSYNFVEGGQYENSDFRLDSGEN